MKPQQKVIINDNFKDSRPDAPFDLTGRKATTHRQLENGEWLIVLENGLQYALPEKALNIVGKPTRTKATFIHHQANEYNLQDKWAVWRNGSRKYIPYQNARILVLVGLRHEPEAYEMRQDVNLSEEEFLRLTSLQEGQSFIQASGELLSPVSNRNRAIKAHF